MDKIIMASKVLIVSDIVKKTQADMFKKLKIGDKIQFSKAILRAGRTTRGGSCAVTIRCENIVTKETTFKTYNELPKILDNFEFIESEDEK